MEDRTEKLAISLEAVERLSACMRAEIIPKLDTTQLLRMGKGERREDIPALQFTCPLLEAALVCDVIRNYDRQVGQVPSELYINRRGVAWSRIVFSQVLTLLVNGKAVLNPQFFPKVNLAAPMSEGVDSMPLVRRK